MFKYAHLRATFDLKKFGIPQWRWFWWWFWAAMVFTIWSHVRYYLVSKPMISKTGWHQFQTKVKSTRIIAADLSLRINPTDQFHMDMKCAQSTTNWDKWSGISNWLKNQKQKITSKRPIFFSPFRYAKDKKNNTENNWEFSHNSIAVFRVKDSKFCRKTNWKKILKLSSP